MTAETFEYAIKKDVRNNPIVREVDRERNREMWTSVGVGVFLVAVLLFPAWQHLELLRHGYRVEEMQKERAAEEEVTRHLRLEIETRLPVRLQKFVIEELEVRDESVFVKDGILALADTSQLIVADHSVG